MPEPDAVSEEKTEEAEWAVLRSRPDPLFLDKTKRLAERFGLKFVEAKLPQALIADFILNVPEGLNLSETLFDFFRTYNVVEFKSQSDQFDEIEYIKNFVRTELLFLQDIGANFENTLNLIVTVRYPQRFLDYMRERGFEFKADKDREWLLRSHVGLQEVVVVVINLLPLRDWAEVIVEEAKTNPKYVAAALGGGESPAMLDILAYTEPSQLRRWLATLKPEKLKEIFPNMSLEEIQAMLNLSTKSSDAKDS